MIYEVVFLLSLFHVVFPLTPSFLFLQVPIDGDLLADGDGLSAAEQVCYSTNSYVGVLN